MSLFISSLNSGSNGNCYYIGRHDEAILVDAGLSCLETEKRMARLSLPMDRIRAIFISHEHTDHIFGLVSLVKKYRIPVYITSSTLSGSRLKLDPALVRSFDPFQPVTVGRIRVTAFPKTHDACDPHSFIVQDGMVTVGVFTDIGKPCDQLKTHFGLCHAAFLEANFDEAMLDQGKYPWFLKNRIRGGSGHLSNAQALRIYLDHRPVFMTHLILSHLSKENNSPEAVESLFQGHDPRVRVVVASRFVETTLYAIEPIAALKTMPVLRAKKHLAPGQPAQLSLF